jgi:hypothetical protein
MIARCRPALAVVVAAATVLGAPAAASSAPRPVLSAMALQASDLPDGAQVTDQGYQRGSGYSAYYQRVFVLTGGRIGRSTPLVVESSVALASNASRASHDLTAARHALRTKAGRASVVRGIAEAAGVSPEAVRPGPVRAVAAGNEAFAWRFTVPGPLGRFDGVLGVVVVDRVLASVIVVSAPHHRALVSDVATLMVATAGHAHDGLLPRSTAPPAVAGGAQAGQTLTATPGAWSPATPPSAFAYQWERCDATGAACSPIPGATAQTYAVDAADTGATLRVSVTASDAVGATTAVSPVTAPVT